ncbi:MAG: hypothetical protein MK135_11935 [Polyangiaceae bacterium]|nr:hypothetical protein [Polyangiaceae bacterium]
MKKKKWGQALYACGAFLTLIAVVAPAFSNPRDDGFPFSTYPMFASRRKAPVLVVAEVVHRDGERGRVEPSRLGTDEVMQAAVTLRMAARKRSSARQLCQKIAKTYRDESSATGPGKTKESDAKRVEIVRASFDPIQYFLESPEPKDRRLVAGCAVHPAKNKQKKRGRKKKKKRNSP